jgi:hypothetical protein
MLLVNAKRVERNFYNLLLSPPEPSGLFLFDIGQTLKRGWVMRNRKSSYVLN